MSVFMYDQRDTYTQRTPAPLPKYISDKMDMLEYDFKIRLTEEERRMFKNAKSSNEVDRIARKVLADHWDE